MRQRALPPELRFTPAPLARNRNACPLLLEAASLYKEIDLDDDFDAAAAFTDLTHEEPALADAAAIARVKAWMQGNKKVLRLLDRAVARGRLRESPGDPESPNIAVALRGFCNLKLARIRLLALAGDGRQAIAEALGLHKLSCVVVSGEGCLFLHLMGLVMLAMALRGFRWLSGRPDVPRAAIERLLRACSRPLAPRKLLRRAVRCEFSLWFLGTLPGVERERDAAALARYLAPENAANRRGIERLLRGHPRAFDREATAARVGHHLLRALRSLDMPWNERPGFRGAAHRSLRRAWPRDLSPDWAWLCSSGGAEGPRSLSRARRRLARVRNPVGRWAEQMMEFNPSRLLRTALRAELDIAAARAVLALRLYFDRKGRHAPSLRALVGERILATVPRDPFDAAPLRYNASRRLLWSVGDNGIEERKGPALGKYGGLNDWMYPVPDFGRTTH